MDIHDLQVPEDIKNYAEFHAYITDVVNPIVASLNLSAENVDSLERFIAWTYNDLMYKSPEIFPSVAEAHIYRLKSNISRMAAKIPRD